ncbi:MAG: 3-carboxy-cis,cis-muconate cycloisomerase [Pseudomonadota bacterium]
MALFENPLFSLFADEATTTAFSPSRTLALYGNVEAAITEALAAEGLISAEARAAILPAIAAFEPDWPDLVAASRRDGLPIPGYVAQMRAKLPEAHRKAFHMGSTSQDIMDTALALALAEINATLASRLAELLRTLDALNARWGAVPLMGRTRMQAALPVTVRHRLDGWRAPLQRQHARLLAVRQDVECLQFGGPVGLRDGWGDSGPAVAKAMAATLGLRELGESWHTGRDGLLAYGAWLSATSQALGKIGADITLMAQQGIDEAALTGGGSSSAMPHKQNPVEAEALVTLARFAAGNLGTLHQGGVHEQERSGVAWALEWMVLPPLCAATGAGLVVAGRLLERIARLGPAPPAP